MKIQDRIIQGYENTRIIHYTDPEIGNLPNRFNYENLSKNAVNGALKGNLFIDGKLKQIYSTRENHVAVIAATRLGKTTSYVIPTVVSFATQKAKKSMVISDPKGEVYRQTAEFLKQQGYKIRVLNFRSSQHSECWNPLTNIFRMYKAAMRVEDEVELVKTDNGYRNRLRGVIYDNQKTLDETIESVRDRMLGDVDNEISNICMLIVPTIPHNDDPYWEDSARELLKAFMWAMLEDSTNGSNRITEDTFSLNTVFTLMLQVKVDGDGFDDGGYFRDRSVASKARQSAHNILLVNARNTAACVISTLNSKLSAFKESALRTIMSCNSFDMRELVNGHTAVFINYRDEIKTHYKVVSLFVKDAYRYLIEQADMNKCGKLDSPFYFILDEFGNFPQLMDFETTISACAGRNIFFILILQSYAQLDSVYGADTAKIIRDNLNMHVFMGSNNPETLDMFSNECGKITRVAPVSSLNGSGKSMNQYIAETIPAVPRSILSHMDEGECLITEANSGYVLFSKLERYYNLDEMKNLPQSDMREYICPINPYDKKYKYDYAHIRRRY